MKAIEPKASQHRSCDIAETKDKIIVRTCGETKGDGGGVEDHGGLRSPLKHRSSSQRTHHPPASQPRALVGCVIHPVWRGFHQGASLCPTVWERQRNLNVGNGGLYSGGYL